MSNCPTEIKGFSVLGSGASVWSPKVLFPSEHPR